ncbi:MAG: DUF3500 domain-containing protein [Myxococcota bacterium]|nr:DUF3500 domain-containing protein [Myxococcota bacterium]
MLLSSLAVLVLTGGRAVAEADPIAAVLSTDLAAFAASLDADQRRTALYRFGDAERFDLRLAPMGLEGLRIDGMSEKQWQLLHGALGRVLSVEGLEKMDTVRSLEREVAETENGLFGWFMGGFRDARRYFLAVFGDPSSDLPWAVRFDGHHLSLNWTVVPRAPLSVTPLFFGGQPREVPADLERAGLRVLDGEEDRALELIAMLSDAQRASAELKFESGGEFIRPMFVGAAANLSVGLPEGVAAAELDAPQREALMHLIDVYLDNFVAPIAERHRSKILSQLPGVHFAYSGVASDASIGLRAGDPLYYRVQGAPFLIEFDDTSSEANHVHVVWRELNGDFGRDVLAEHYLEGGHHTTDD